MISFLFAQGQGKDSKLNGWLFVADGLWFFIAALLALAVGTAGDRFFRHPSLGWHYQPAALRATPTASLLVLEDLQRMLRQPNVVALDARPGVFFELGHLPGAHSLSRQEFDTDFARLEPILRTAGKDLIIYCSDAECEDSTRVAGLLRERGFHRVSVFVGGFAEWEAAGQPVEVAK